MAGAVNYLSPTEQGTNLTNLVILSMETIAALTNPLVGKPVMKSKAQKSNHLSGTGNKVRSPAERALISYPTNKYDTHAYTTSCHQSYVANKPKL